MKFIEPGNLRYSCIRPTTKITIKMVSINSIFFFFYKFSLFNHYIENWFEISNEQHQINDRFRLFQIWFDGSVCSFEFNYTGRPVHARSYKHAEEGTLTRKSSHVMMWPIKSKGRPQQQSPSRLASCSLLQIWAFLYFSIEFFNIYIYNLLYIIIW